SYPCQLVPGTKAAKAYQALGYGSVVQERHRHRFEFNNAYRSQMQANGLVFSGLSPDGRLVEISELADHPFMMGSQFHPELKSRPNKPHPLFYGLIQAAKAFHHGRNGNRAGQSGMSQETIQTPVQERVVNE